MGNNSGKEPGGAKTSQPTSSAGLPNKQPTAPGDPRVLARDSTNVLEQLAYQNKPDDAVVLRWAAPESDGGTPINGYVVEKKLANGQIWSRANPVDVRETEVALTGLQPGGEYLFRVRAINAIGWSPPSSESAPFRMPLDPASASPPSFPIGLRNVNVMEHEKVEFRVEVSGLPPPSVHWSVNDSSILSTADGRMRVVEDEGPGISVLVLNDVLAADDGEVKCLAVNEGGQATTTAILTVEAPPRAILTKKYEEGLIFEEGDVIRLRVEFTGRPRPEVAWYHEGDLLTADDSDGRLEIETDGAGNSTILKLAKACRADRGEYSVKLQSGLGEDTASFLVTIANRPSPPSKPMVVEVGESTAVLQWDPPEDDGGCEISSYIIEYNRLGWDMWLKASTARQPGIRLTELIPGSVYHFRVKAENPYGVSEPSPKSEPILLPPASESWIPPSDAMTEDPMTELGDDTTISSSNLGPRDDVGNLTDMDEMSAAEGGSSLPPWMLSASASGAGISSRGNYYSHYME